MPRTLTAESQGGADQPTAKGIRGEARGQQVFKDKWLSWGHQMSLGRSFCFAHVRTRNYT